MKPYRAANHVIERQGIGTVGPVVLISRLPLLKMLPPRQVLRAKELLPGARILPLPGCGHVPMTDDPALVADILLQGSGSSDG